MSLPEYPQNPIPRPFANNGSRQLIPDDKMAAGRASFKEGFPVETQLPLNSGGIAPNRTDFNGIFHMLSSLAFWQQSGGQMAYNAGLDYNVPGLVFFEGRLWWCLRPNGPSTVTPGVVPPGTDNEVWRDFVSFLRSDGHGAAQAMTQEEYDGHPDSKLTDGVLRLIYNNGITTKIIINGQEYQITPDLRPLWDALDTKLDAADYSGFPSDTYDTLALPAQDAFVTALADGFFVINGQATASSFYINANIVSSAGQRLHGNFIYSSSYIAIFLPVSRGQRLQMNWERGVLNSLRFIPARRAPGL